CGQGVGGGRRVGGNDRAGRRRRLCRPVGRRVGGVDRVRIRAGREVGVDERERRSVHGTDGRSVAEDGGVREPDGGRRGAPRYGDVAAVDGGRGCRGDVGGRRR